MPLMPGTQRRTARKARTYAAVTACIVVLLASDALLQRGTVAQQLPPARASEPQPQASAIPRIVAISRTPEGFRLGARKAEIFDQMRTKWGIDYMPLNVVWDRYWYPSNVRTSSGRFTMRRCIGDLNIPICEGTVLRSTTASMIEIVAFQDRVFRISITLPAASDYRLQAENMLALLRQKYGPPAQGPRWRDEVTELIFDRPIVSPGWPPTLHYVDVSRNAEVRSTAEKLIQQRDAEIRARSLLVPRGY